MADENCVSCGGRGFVPQADGTTPTCHCVLMARWIAGTKATPGLEGVTAFGRGCLVGNEPLKGSALIRCAWPLMREHVAGWIYVRLRGGARPKVLVTSCADLRSMYLGGDGETTRSQLARLRTYELVVVRLLGIRNKLTTEALLEALSFAPVVWIVYSPGNTFQQGHPAWSPEIEEFVVDFQRLDLGTAAESAFSKIGIAGGGK